MADLEHVSRLKDGVDAWNAWRNTNKNIRPDLRGADLRGENLARADLLIADLREAVLAGADLQEASLFEADLRGAILSEADIRFAQLYRANLRGADLRKATLFKANLVEADLREAILTGASLEEAKLFQAKLVNADLAGADLREAMLGEADLSGANLRDAILCGVNFVDANLARTDFRRADLARVDFARANLYQANLAGADLQRAIFVETNLANANLTGCHIYGISAWRLKLAGATQRDLIITAGDEPKITVDNIEVAQFISLLLYNEKIRDVIDTITSKAVLILGRFTPKRKKVLDVLREELRTPERNYVPIVFDFDKPSSKDLTGTVSTLAHMARFIIADLTDPSCIPYELATVVPTTRIPVQPILLSGKSEFAMFADLERRYHWVLPTYHYDTPEHLIANVHERVIRPAEIKVLELQGTKSE